MNQVSSALWVVLPVSFASVACSGNGVDGSPNRPTGDGMDLGAAAGGAAGSISSGDGGNGMNSGPNGSAAGGATGGVPASGASGGSTGTGGEGSGGDGSFAESCVGSDLLVCLDFESGDIPAGWQVEGGGVSVVDAPFGSKALRLAVPEGSGHKAFLTSELSGAGPHLYVAVRFLMVLPEGKAPGGHGSFLEAYGNLANGGERALYAFGVQAERFMGNYVRFHSEGIEEHVAECHPEFGTSACSDAERSAVLVPVSDETCLEFEFDADTPSPVTLSRDGQPLYLHPYTPSGWQKLAGFDTLELGFKEYHDHPALELYLDDVRIDDAPVSCAP